jgi:hypothetical protein
MTVNRSVRGERKNVQEEKGTVHGNLQRLVDVGKQSGGGEGEGEIVKVLRLSDFLRVQNVGDPAHNLISQIRSKRRHRRQTFSLPAAS